MIANRLNILLAERYLTIKDVIDNTGISRNAISNIVNKPLANISTETIDILCNYLDVTPNEFFEFSPYLINVNINDDIDHDTSYILDVSIISQKKETKNFYLINMNTMDNVGMADVRKNKYDLYFEIYTEYTEFNELYPSLSPVFQRIITKSFINKIEQALNDNNISKKLSIYLDAIKGANSGIEENFNEYIKKQNKENFSLSITFPWEDISKKLILKNNEYIID
ncbi:hypothetical protein CPR19092_LGOLGGFK_02437 [Companilactobacillus paralimentarius]|uniref:helix-turn-helix domain-containing protein n=1 Tax=Companilactobacillus paralimentarius TaxID=83526 RepID=UPI00384E6D1B